MHFAHAWLFVLLRIYHTGWYLVCRHIDAWYHLPMALFSAGPINFRLFENPAGNHCQTQNTIQWPGVCHALPKIPSLRKFYYSLIQFEPFSIQLICGQLVYQLRLRRSSHYKSSGTPVDRTIFSFPNFCFLVSSMPLIWNFIASELKNHSIRICKLAADSSLTHNWSLDSQLMCSVRII